MPVFLYIILPAVYYFRAMNLKNIIPTLLIASLSIFSAKAQTLKQYDSIIAVKIKSNKLQEALDIYNKVISSDTTKYWWCADRGDLKMKMGDYKGAIADFSKVLSHNRDAQWFYFRAMAYYLLKDYNHALADFADALKEDPSMNLAYEAHFIMGNIKFKQEDLPGSIDEYSKSIVLKPKYAKAWYNRGVSKYFANLKQGAVKDVAYAQQLGFTDVDPQIKKYCDYYAAHK